MQPYFLPYIGYWQLIANTEKFIFFDVVQYNKRSWMNRNRILHPDKFDDFQYITVPIKKHERGSLISDVEISYEEDWVSEIFGKLTLYRKLNAPYYSEVSELLFRILKPRYSRFLDLVVHETLEICNFLGLKLNYQLASEISFDREIIAGPGDWALSVCKSLGASSYINPYGGYEIFDEKKYFENDVKIQFLKSNLSPYKQSWRKEFIPGLSIIDLLMFLSKEEIRDYLYSDYKLFDKEELISEIVQC